MKNAYLEAGRFNGTHGVKGALKAECWCDSFDVLASLKTVYLDKNGKRALRVTRCVPYQDKALMFFEGYDSPEAAGVLKNRVFYAAREDLPLPEGSWFLADLIGMRVYDADSGRDYGKVRDVSENAASMLYEIEDVNGKTVYLPDVPEFVISIDEEKGIAVRPVKGLFDEI